MTIDKLAKLMKVGFDAVIDEVTGYQYTRPKGDLAQRHKKYLRKED